MTEPRYASVQDPDEGPGFTVFRNGAVYCTGVTAEQADQIVKDFTELGTTLKHCHEDARMALSGEWDRGDDGFKATKDGCMDALLSVGYEMDDHDYKTTSFENEEDNEEGQDSAPPGPEAGTEAQQG